jgi:hypothetical protein
MKAFKKVFSLLFALIFVATNGVSFALAAGGSAVGWISLLPQKMSDVPVQVQARDHFFLILPQLLQAKRAGQILDFAPDFSDGLLRIAFPSMATPTSMFNHPVFSKQINAMQSSNFAALQIRSQHDAISVNPRIAGSQTRIVVFNYANCIVIYANDNNDVAIPNAGITATLKDTFGTVLDTEGATASSSGSAGICFSSSTPVIPGMDLDVLIYDPNDASTSDFNATVPYILFSSLNLKAGILGVKTNFATPLGGAKFWVPQLDHQYRDAGNTSVWSTPVSYTRNSKSTSFTFRFGHPICGSDYISMQVSDPSGVYIFNQHMYADYVFCIIGDDYCQVFGLSGKAAAIKIKHGTTIGQLKGKFDYTVGSLYGNLLDKYGNPVTVSIGDQISPLTANIDTPTPRNRSAA